MNDLGQLARLATPTLRRRLQITSNRHFIRICENAQFWVGALDGFDVAHPGPAVTEDGVALARHVAADGTVLVHNAGALPLDASAVTSVAVIGHNARYARSQGGGSATVIPERVVSPLEGIRAVLPGAEVTYSVGAVVQEGVAELPLAAISNPATGGPGVRVRFLRKGRELFAEDRRATALVWFGGDAPISDSDTLELSTRYVPEISGPIVLGFAAVGMARIFVDGRLRHEGTVVPVGTDLGAAFLSPPSSSGSAVRNTETPWQTSFSAPGSPAVGCPPAGPPLRPTFRFSRSPRSTGMSATTRAFISDTAPGSRRALPRRGRSGTALVTPPGPSGRSRSTEHLGRRPSASTGLGEQHRTTTGEVRDSGLRQQRRFCGGPSGSVAGGICRRTRSRRRNRRHDD